MSITDEKSQKIESYAHFIDGKAFIAEQSGFECGALNERLKPFQSALIRKALSIGKYAFWWGCGLGKSLAQLVWAEQVFKHTSQPVLILAPCAVSAQTKREADKFSIDCPVAVVSESGETIQGVNITNYEKLHKFDCDAFSGIVLDESSILKSSNGKVRTQIIEKFKRTSYKLACSATPSPNDYKEIGSHAQFLGMMSESEMLSMFFTHDGGDTSKWRLKGHAQNEFWKWLTTWAVMIENPSDIGFDGGEYILPPLNIQSHVTHHAMAPTQGELVRTEAKGLNERRKVRKATIGERVAIAAELVNSSDEQWLVWCDLNDESSALTKLICDAVEIRGSDKSEKKEKAAINFANNNIRVLVSKPSIFGFGLNFQSCQNTIFVGLSDSYEAYYQAIRRNWRFGQTKDVNCHVIYDALEGAVVRNIQRKDMQMKEMMANMIEQMQRSTIESLASEIKPKAEYNALKKMEVPVWLAA